VSKKNPIATRIARAYFPGITYAELFDAVFPEAEYPEARRYQSNGGPPGACMAFGAALRRMRASWRRPGDRVIIDLAVRDKAMMISREQGRDSYA